MKNKKSLYILIPLVVIIWGLILWKMFLFSSSEESMSFHLNSKDSGIAGDTVSYLLKANYSDPFLRSGKMLSNTSDPPKSIKGISKIKAENLSSITKVPSIIYNGLVEYNNHMTAIITFENSNHLLRKGDVLDDIRILNIYPDSIRVLYNNNTYLYERK